MPKRLSNDPSLFAKNVLDHIIEKYDTEAVGPVAETISDAPTKNPHAVALGKLGGSKGGQQRAKNLSATKRKQIARKAAKARWRKG